MFLVDFELFHGTGALARVGLLVVQFSLGIVIGLLATVGNSVAYRAVGVTLAIALLASPFNIDNLILPYHLSIPLVCLLALLAFYWVTLAALAPTWRDAATATFLSCGMILLAPYATANGLIAAVMAAILVWILRANRLSAALVTASAAMIVVSYFWHWTFPQQHEELLASSSGIRGLWQIATHSLVLLGAPGLFLGPTATGLFGLVGFVLWLAVLVAMLQRVRQSRAPDAHFIVLFTLATFALGTAVMIAFGRAGAGLGQALSTRYATFSLVFWLALLGAIWRWRTNAVGELSLGFERRVVLGLAAALLVFAYGAWFRVVESWRTQVAVLDQVTAELVAGRFDRILMAQIYPQVDRLPAAIEFLRHRKLSIFARPSQ